MRSFTAKEINDAYANVDQRVILAMDQINIDQAIINLKETFHFHLDKLDELRTVIDFVLVGLASARELNEEVKNLFPEKNNEVIKLLNKEVFVPVLEYVKSRQPIEGLSVQKTDTQQKTDPFAASNITIMPNNQVDWGEKPEETDLESVLKGIPNKPGFVPEEKQPTDPYQETV